MKNKYVSFSLAFLLIVFCPLQSVIAAASKQDIDNQVNEAIKLLCMDDDAQRYKGKELILNIGMKAIAPLLVTLKAVADNSPDERIFTYKDTIQVPQSAYRFQREIEILKRRLTAQARSRLKQDIINLLVSLHAEESVPLLVKLLLQEPEIAGLKREIMYPEMKALVELGTISVPHIIELIVTSDAIANAMPIYDKLISEEEKIARINSIKHLIQKRAVIILGKIRDARALPTLYHLFHTTKEESLLSYIEEAIVNIEQNPN